MDQPRIGYAQRKRVRRIAAGSAVAVAFLAVVWAVSRIEPAVPGVDAAVVFTDTVKRGEMVRVLSVNKDQLSMGHLSTLLTASNASAWPLSGATTKKNRLR